MRCRWEQLPPANRQQLLRLLARLVERQLDHETPCGPAGSEEVNHDRPD